MLENTVSAPPGMESTLRSFKSIELLLIWRSFVVALLKLASKLQLRKTRLSLWRASRDDPVIFLRSEE